MVVTEVIFVVYSTFLSPPQTLFSTSERLDTQFQFLIRPDRAQLGKCFVVITSLDYETGSLFRHISIKV